MKENDDDGMTHKGRVPRGLGVGGGVKKSETMTASVLNK